MDRKEIIQLRDRTEKKINDLEKLMIRSGSPEGYKEGTSYNDYDTIHGSKKECDVIKLGNELIRLKALRDTYDYMLENEEIQVNEDEILSKLKGRVEQVRFLRVAQGHTQQEVADKLNIGLRTVQRIEKELRCIFN